MFKVIIVALVVTVVAIIATTVVDNMTVNDTYSQSIGNNQSADENLIAVSLDGEIRYAGTYYLEEDSTLKDAMDLAGGPTSNADPLAYNTSYILENGMSFYIAPLYDNSSTCSAAPITKVNINKAEAEELQAVAGFTKTVASAIVSYRVSKSFEAIEEIKNVSGIGAATYLSCRDKITLRDAS